VAAAGDFGPATVSPMTPAELLVDALTRTAEGVDDVLDGLSDEELVQRPGPDANSIAWLIWHIARVQDDHVAHVSDIEQVYTAQGFAARFDLPFDVRAIGYGHTSDEVEQVRAPGSLLREYSAAVHTQCVEWISTVSETDLDRIVDTRWDPPVTLGARLVSVADDSAQHIGQAAYVKGLLGH
jgi:hypothetical protein